jgi:hypothetical protein
MTDFRGLEYYVESGELPDDIDTLLAIGQEMGATDPAGGLLADGVSTLDAAQVERATRPAEPEPPPVESPPASQTAAPQDPAPQAPAKGDPEVPLKQLRWENHQLKQQLAELAGKVESMASTQAPGQDPPEGEGHATWEERIGDLEVDFPDAAEVSRGIRDEVRSENRELKQRLAQLEQREQQRIAEAQAAQLAKIDEAVSANPMLANWRDNDPELWDMAIKQDELLRASPAFADKSLAERFEAVAKAVAVATGAKYTLPQEKVTNASVTPPASAPKAPAGNRPPVYSLSDIPGGEGPASSETERVDGMSAMEVGAMFQSMSPDQIDAWLKTHM